MARCEIGWHYYDTREAVDTMAGFADDLFVVQEVIQPLAAEYGTDLHMHVCKECFLDKVWNERNRYEVVPDSSGHIVYTQDEERYGRNSEDKAPRFRKGNPHIMARKNAAEETAVTETIAPEGVTEEAAETAEAVPAEPQKTAEELQAERLAALAEQLPVGTPVQLVNKGSDFGQAKGHITGHELRRGVPYPQMTIETFANGKPRPEEKRKVILTRVNSLAVVDDFDPNAVEEPVAAEAPAEEQVVTEGTPSEETVEA
jgi:hypothetical protein